MKNLSRRTDWHLEKLSNNQFLEAVRGIRESAKDAGHDVTEAVRSFIAKGLNAQ